MKTRPCQKNLDKLKDHEFGISLTNINLQVNYGEILGVAGIAGNGQVELMEILSGEINCEDNALRILRYSFLNQIRETMDRVVVFSELDKK